MLSIRPGRSALNLVGTILGVAGIVATLGLGSTAQQQVSATFDLLRATEVIIEPSAIGSDASVFGPDPEHRLAQLNGVEVAGVSTRQASGISVSKLADGSHPILVDLVAMTPAAMQALDVRGLDGEDSSRYLDLAPNTALVGDGLFAQLGLPPLEMRPTIWIHGRALSVVGIVVPGPTDPRVQGWLIIPADLARTIDDDTPPQSVSIVVKTSPGAAQQVATEIPFALRPDAPLSVRAFAPPDPASLRLRIESDTTLLVLGAAIIILIVGSISMATTTLIGVLERIPEFGLRRVAGARPRHLLILVLLETAISGAVGGSLGAMIGVVVVVGVSLANGWAPILDPLLPLQAVGVGAIAGILAGVVPARRASKIEPVEALRR